jgi:HEAT repeat protein
MLRSRANEIPDLMRRLRSRKRACVDAARARLAIIGPRAVGHLTEALEGGEAGLRARAMPLLALIQDPRGRAPLIAMLLDRSARLRGIAASCLARFPAPDATSALIRLLADERNDRVAVTAIQALIEHHRAGQDAALRRLLELLADRGARPRRRLATFDLLPRLRAVERSAILERLRDDPVAEIRQAACEFEVGGQARDRPGEEIRATLTALGASDYAAWNQAVQRLAARGREVVGPLLAEMQSRAHDPEYCKRAGMALKALGPRRASALAGALDQIDEPLPLQVLVEVAGALGEKPLIYRLKDLIDRLARRPTHVADHHGWDPMQRVRARAHLELARIGSRVAISDLRAALADRDRRLELELLSAIERIGKKDELLLLAAAWEREDEITRPRIAEAVRAIMHRERIRRNSPLFRTFPPNSRQALDCMLPRNGRRVAPSRDEVV